MPKRQSIIPDWSINGALYLNADNELLIRFPRIHIDIENDEVVDVTKDSVGVYLTDHRDDAADEDGRSAWDNWDFRNIGHLNSRNKYSFYSTKRERMNRVDAKNIFGIDPGFCYAVSQTTREKLATMVIVNPHHTIDPVDDEPYWYGNDCGHFGQIIRPINIRLE